MHVRKPLHAAGPSSVESGIVPAEAMKALNTATRTRTTGKRQLMWLALLLVAWTQIAVAGHQFEHTGAGAADSCEICVQLDRTDGALLPAGAMPCLAASQPSIAAPAAACHTVPLTPAYSPRAPPTL